MADDLPLQERVRLFNALGTPTPMHVGTSELVNDLWRELEKLSAALAPFAKGAGEIPDSWPDHRALLIDEKHPDNPKKYCLLLARVEDFRRARSAISAGVGDRSTDTTEHGKDGCP